MRGLIIADSAADDLENLVDFIAQDRPENAEAVFRTLVAAARRVTEFPAMGRPGRHPLTREFSVPDLVCLFCVKVCPCAAVQRFA
ncbi:type II toxin-antitoxin system RelE/ParE family toxin, partial [Neogemmobacter tilapiae]|uniref:type II toxin-antitoxin system RelE/ParE family toxin n=1 Tax=Neogemmobacter tilapiae TaxID=875041 RepID=UPI0016757D7C